MFHGADIPISMGNLVPVDFSSATMMYQDLGYVSVDFSSGSKYLVPSCSAC
jgi:hypothetical protein